MAHGKKNAFKGVSKKTETEYTHVLKNREDGETQKEKKNKDSPRGHRESYAVRNGCREKWVEKDLCVGKRKC